MVRDVVIIVAQPIRQDENGIERRERIVAPIRKRRKKKKTKKRATNQTVVVVVVVVPGREVASSGTSAKPSRPP